MKNKTPLILITNDDGIEAQGLKDVYDGLQGLGRRFVVAPMVNQSAASHSFSLRKPIKVQKLRPGWFAVDGTPTDCVLISHHGILKRTIDLVVSGINDSPNMGDDVLYSGTVAAAIEGALLGVAGVAISYVQAGVNRESAVKFLRSLVPILLNGVLPKKTLLNVNIPAEPVRGVKVTKLGRRIYRDMAIKESLPDGRVFWTIDGEMGFARTRGSDFEAVYEGYISVTPLHLDMTHHQQVFRLERAFRRSGLIR